MGLRQDMVRTRSSCRPRSADAEGPACLEFNQEFLLRRGLGGPCCRKSQLPRGTCSACVETRISPMIGAHVRIHDQMMAIKTIEDLGSASATARIRCQLAVRIRTPELGFWVPEGADGAG